MSTQFQKGQLVVVNSPEEDDRQWHLRLYESLIAPDVHKTYNPEKENYDTWSWCRPAEDVWPFIFLGREHSKTGMVSSMSEQFKKDQLVAVAGGTFKNRRIRIFCGYYSTGTNDGETWFLCREAGESEKDAIAWPRCVPLEDVEPGAFVGWERRAGEQAADAVAMESELVQRLRRQIEWLCMTAQNYWCPPGFDLSICPRGIHYNPEPKDCADCWEQASRKAVTKEESDE